MKPEEALARKKYNYIAEDYHNLRTKKYPEGWFYNELLEMPCTLKVLGNIKGKKVLDFGCGTGIYAKILTKKEAIVKGFDISPEMIKIAKKENPDLDLRVGSGYKIPFNEKFDIILAPLVVHYLSNWNKLFTQINRVLSKGGIFIFSIGNPVTETSEKIKVRGKRLNVFGDYFTERKMNVKWHNINGKDVKMFFHHLTFETIIKTILKNGFQIIDYRDCYPVEKSKKLFPEDYKICSQIPYFSVWKVMKK